MHRLESAGFKDYLRAFAARWFVVVSGPLSVPAAIAAAWVENPIARVLLALTASACFIFSSYWIWKIERENRIAADALGHELRADFAQFYPDVRVADNPDIIALFNGAERNKLMGLLDADWIWTWARPLHPSDGISTDFIRIQGTDWHRYRIDFEKKTDDPRSVNHTYLRSKRGNTAVFYDLCFNSVHLKRVWSLLPFETSNCDVLQAQCRPSARSPSIRLARPSMTQSDTSRIVTAQRSV
jgi:hypothetical protein